jgi:hypothetical protein
MLDDVNIKECSFFEQNSMPEAKYPSNLLVQMNDLNGPLLYWPLILVQHEKVAESG